MRVVGLLTIIRYLEPRTSQLSENQLADLIDEGIVDCGFADEIDALRAVISLLEKDQGRADDETLDQCFS